jgi:tRNA G10  N-methylase Trm11
MKFLVRFTQSHETFRLAEIQALADLENIDLKVISYGPEVRQNYDEQFFVTPWLSFHSHHFVSWTLLRQRLRPSSFVEAF